MRNLAVLALALVVTALLPTRITGWVSWWRGPFEAVVAPVAGPASVVGGWLRPERRMAHPDATTPESELVHRVDELTREYFVALDRIQDLDALVRELQEGAEYGATTQVSRVEASRVGANLASGTIDVARGARDGVTPGSVAVARRSQQVVGIVTTVRPMVSTVHLLTDGRLSPGLMVGVVMPRRAPGVAVDLATLPRVQLKPAGDGTLVADAVGIGDASRIEVGQRVRLMDETWPAAAAMLVLGQVVSVDTTDEPLFRRVVVRPEVDPKDVRAFILHIPREDVGGGAGR
jgi:hypothetical protein